MAIAKIQRTFKFKDEILPDPNPSWPEKRVKQFYSDQYPELVNANISAPKYEGENAVYEFETNLGTKG